MLFWLLVGVLRHPPTTFPLQSVLTLAAYRQATRNSYREWRYHMLHVYNYVLLKMSTWCSKHVEENSILWINNNQCIKLVINAFRKSVGNIHVSLISDINNGYFTRRKSTFLIISRSDLLRLRNVSDRSCKWNQNTFYVQKLFFFRKSCRLRDYVENILEPDRTQMTIRRKRHAVYQRPQTHTQNM